MSIELMNAGYTYKARDGREIKALLPADTTIAPGEFVAIVGANGSGKTTLAKLLNALLVPTEGHVVIDGQDTSGVNNLILARKTVGMVFQNPDNQLVATTVEDDVAFGPENLGLPVAQLRGRVDQALDLLGISELRALDPHQLSSGQKQKVAIAGILAIMPRYMVLDEPTSMLDPIGRRDVLAAIDDLRREREMGLVYITHIIEEAVGADKVIVMKEGAIVAQGKPREILSNETLMVNCSLYTPKANRLARALARRELPIRTDIITSEEVVEAICSLS